MSMLPHQESADAAYLSLASAVAASSSMSRPPVDVAQRRVGTRRSSRKAARDGGYASSTRFSRFWPITSREKSAPKKPTWEPAVQRPAWKIEQSPHLEEEALRSLQRQGCQTPLKHYYPDHKCDIPSRRLQCARDVRRWQRGRQVVLTMAQKLPKEVVIQIMEYMALDTMSHVWLHDANSLDAAARRLLGESPVTEPLVPYLCQAILEQSILAMDTQFQRTDQDRTAVLPAHVLSLPHPVRKLLLTLSFEIPIGRQKYPAVIYTAKAGMRSLLAQLSGLRALHFFLNVELTRPPWDHQPSAFDVGCRKGFSGTTTFRHAVSELLDAAQTERPGLEIYLEIKYTYEGTWRGTYRNLPQTYNVAKGAMTSEEVLKAAEAKWTECHFSQG